MAELEPGIVTDLRDRLTYGGYLHLDRLLDAQHPLSGAPERPARHDEMLFIIQHQVAELWMKLMIHELRAAIAYVRADALEPAFKILARVKLIQKQLFEQWAVLETLTPSEYEGFRPALGTSSGFQSPQYRAIEFLLGNKNAAIVDVFRHDEAVFAELDALLRAPSLYDEFLRLLARRGLPVPRETLERDVTQPYVRNPALVPVFQQIYADPCAVVGCLRHVREADRRRGGVPALALPAHEDRRAESSATSQAPGGSSGVGFLRRALEQSFFPELIDVRTVIGTR
jgi:tryptophan 2,3-dioxygenase